jgi:uncharacterized protein YbjT (DUF2867 family)
LLLPALTNSISALVSDGKYAVRVLSRSTTSPEAIELSSLPGVTIFQGSSYYEPDLRQAFRGVTHAFVNTNGFAIGEKAEIYWGIRLYELAREFGLQHFLYASLEYASRLGNFQAKYRTGHLDGKGKVVDYLRSQPTYPMKWSVLTSCLYMEGLTEFLSPRPDPENPQQMMFAVPLGDGRCPLIYLGDYGQYARWMFDSPSKSVGIELHVATEDIAWKDLAAAFTEVTGKKAVYKDVTLEEYFSMGLFPNVNAKIGQGVAGDDNTLFTIKQNFTGFWNTWKDELTKRDYAMLDEILPGRVKSVKEWMVKTGYTGAYKPLLKDVRDRAAVQKAV